MVRTEVVFQCGDNLMPEIAARLAQVAERHRAKLLMECGGKRVLLDSLIGILSVECARGTTVGVIAEGEDEQAAMESAAAVLAGRCDG